MIQQCSLRISRCSFCLWWIHAGRETNGSCRPFLPNSTRNTHLHSLNIEWNILNIVEAEAEIFVQCFLIGKDSQRVPLNLSGLLDGTDSTDSFLCCQTSGVRCFSCANAAWRRSHHHTVLVNARLLNCGSRDSDLSRLRHTEWSFLSRSKLGAVKNKPCICSASILDHRPADYANHPDFQKDSKHFQCEYTICSVCSRLEVHSDSQTISSPCASFRSVLEIAALKLTQVVTFGFLKLFCFASSI